MTPGTLHTYHPSRNLLLFEHTPHNPTSTSPFPSPPATDPPKHILLFIGGLYDNFLLPSYTTELASLFPLPSTPTSPPQPWRLIHTQLSSAGRSWGVFTIDRDIEEIATAITYIRTHICRDENADVVLMGHSTGCQDIMRYLTAPNPLGRGPARPAVQGAILQAPVSDRDGAMHAIETGPEVKSAYDAIMEIVQSTPEAKHRDTVLPVNLTRQVFGPAPVNVERWLSLVSPDSPGSPSVEDFFSNDLSDETLRGTFGRIGRGGLLGGGEGSLLVLMSDSDEYVRPHVGQRDLLERWRGIMGRDTGCVVNGGSAVILNAMHDVAGDDWPSQEARLVVLRGKVMKYLRERVGDVGGEVDEIWRGDRDRVMEIKAGDGRKIEEQVGVLKL